MKDARKLPRQALALALEMDDESTRRRGRLGVTRNLSPRGLLLNTPSRFEVGTELGVRLHLADGGQKRFAASVIRVEESQRGSDDPWRYRLALELLGQGELPAHGAA